MAAELTQAQIEMFKQQRAQRFKELGLPATAGQIAEAVVENLPTQRVYEQPVQEQIDYASSQPTYQEPSAPNQNFDPSTQANIENDIRKQIAEERAQRMAVLNNAPRDKFNVLQSIKNGAKKQEFSAFMKAETHGASGVQLPEPKVGKRRPGQQEKSQFAVEPKGNNVPESREAKMFEQMFTDGNSSIGIRQPGANLPKGNLIETDENYSNIGAAFDPVAHLQKKASEKGLNIDFQNSKRAISEGVNHQVFQEQNSDYLQKMMIMMESMIKNQNQTRNYDIELLKQEVKAIAKKTAEETIKAVLKEYLESQKKKNVFEVVNKEKNIVKVGDKFFKLQQVVLKS